MINEIMTCEWKYGFKTFTDDLLRNIRKWLPKQLQDAEISLHKIQKNNGKELTALIIRKLDSNVAPNIYIDKYYRKYNNGISIESIARDIAQTREALEYDNRMSGMDGTFILDFDKCRDKIMPRLIGVETNEKMLRDHPHVIIADLAVTFYLDLGMIDEECVSARVNNGMAARWGVTADELYQIAVKNIEDADTDVFRSMYDVLLGVLPDDDLIEMAQVDNMMFVLTSKSMVYGAAAVLNKKMMRRVIDKIGDRVIVLPSSVHEVLILPDNENMTKSDLQEMVKEVNRTQVPRDEILSDSVYRYTLQDGLVEM